MRLPVISKGVNGKFPIGIQYTEPDLESGETILAAEADVSPTGLTLQGSVQINGDGDTITQVIDGGVAGTDYTVQFKVTTSNSKIFQNPERDAWIVKVI